MVSKSINKKKANKTIKPEFLNLLQENNNVKEKELNETASNLSRSNSYNSTRTLLKHKIKKQLVIMVGRLLEKFKDTENFFDNIDQSRSTIYFKISLYKFLKKYSLLKISVLQSSYFKNNFKATKVICK